MTSHTILLLFTKQLTVHVQLNKAKLKNHSIITAWPTQPY